jgi:hypothetical protein
MGKGLPLVGTIITPTNGRTYAACTGKTGTKVTK